MLLSVGALLVFVWKVLVVPLWTWDHFAIWGMKSRRMLPDGILRVEFLSTPAFGNTHPDYPIGAPIAWRIFSLGALPDDVTVKLVHVLLGVGLAIVFHRLLTVAGLPYRSAEAWTGLVVISPLFWDTESLGAALAIALVRRSRAAIWIASLVIGQSVFYGFTYFATYLNPLDHVRSSFHRIMAALLPIAVATTAISLCGRPRSDPLDTDGAGRF